MAAICSDYTSWKDTKMPVRIHSSSAVFIRSECQMMMIIFVLMWV